MSSYTITLKEMVELYTMNAGGNFRDKIEIARPKLFNFDYPIFDEAYKKVFETHFIRNFFMREIGSETEELFKFRLETWLGINMPYFNKMFESELIQYDPLKNSESDETHNVTKDTGSTSTADQTSQHDSTSGSDANSTTTENDFTRDLESDNPDSRLTITANDGVGVIEYAKAIKESTANNSATNTSHSDGTNTATGTSNVTGTANINETEDYIQHRVGKIGVQTYAKMIQEHRQAFLRIENKMFDEMQELFMLVY